MFIRYTLYMFPIYRMYRQIFPVCTYLPLSSGPRLCLLRAAWWFTEGAAFLFSSAAVRYAKNDDKADFDVTFQTSWMEQIFTSMRPSTFFRLRNKKQNVRLNNKCIGKFYNWDIGLESCDVYLWLYTINFTTWSWFKINRMIHFSDCEYIVMIFPVCTVSVQNKYTFTAIPFLSNQSCSIFLSLPVFLSLIDNEECEEGNVAHTEDGEWWRSLHGKLRGRTSHTLRQYILGFISSLVHRAGCTITNKQ